MLRVIILLEAPIAPKKLVYFLRMTLQNINVKIRIHNVPKAK